MEDIQVSVIVPVYNAEKYIEQCVESICKQTLQKIEILLVDDSSTDSSLSILQKYAKQDDRITVVENEHTGDGAASARNAGLSIAKGKYLSFLDADDFFELDMLEKAYEKAEAVSADIIMFDGYFFDHSKQKAVPSDFIIKYNHLPKKEVFSKHDFPDTIFTCTTSAAWSKLFRRQFIQDENLYFQGVYHSDDVLFVTTAFAMAKKITVIKEKLVWYRFGHVESQASNKSKKPLSVVFACMAMKDLLKEKGVFEIVKNGYANYVVDYVSWCLHTYPTTESFTTLYEALANEYLEQLEIENCLTKNMLNFDVSAWILGIKKNDAVSYGFLNQQYKRDDLFFKYSTNKLFPKEKIKRNETIVLYGAGEVGKAFYIQNLLENYCNVIAWVDKNGNDMPHPIQGIDDLQAFTKYKVLVSICNPQIVERIQKDLIASGFATENIVMIG